MKQTKPTFRIGLLLAVSLLCLLMLAPSALAASKNPIVVIETTMGRIMIMLYPKDAPITCSNFVRYVNDGHYDGTIFHRIIRNVREPNIIQGGGFDETLYERPAKYRPIRNESKTGLRNKKGVVSMARVRAPHSAQAQFFINLEEAPMWDYKAVRSKNSEDKKIRWGYAGFAKVIRGMSVVEAINKVPHERRGMMKGVPKTPIIIKRMYVVDRKK